MAYPDDYLNEKTTDEKILEVLIEILQEMRQL